MDFTVSYVMRNRNLCRQMLVALGRPSPPFPVSFQTFKVYQTAKVTSTSKTRTLRSRLTGASQGTIIPLLNTESI
jgi:hypothetical protein